MQVSCVKSGVLTFVFQYGGIMCLIRVLVQANYRVPAQDKICENEPERFKSG